jgi:hypothetical protein
MASAIPSSTLVAQGRLARAPFWSGTTSLAKAAGSSTNGMTKAHSRAAVIPGFRQGPRIGPSHSWLTLA